MSNPTQSALNAAVGMIPGVGWGRPVLLRLGVNVDFITDRFMAGESIASLAEDYAATEEEVEAAIRHCFGPIPQDATEDAMDEAAGVVLAQLVESGQLEQCSDLPPNVGSSDLDQLRVRVAELCGFVRSNTVWQKDGMCFRRPDLPDYPRDLNAMHEAEGALTTDDELSRYTDELATECGTMREIAFATAEQRARAFVKVMEGK